MLRLKAVLLGLTLLADAGGLIWQPEQDAVWLPVLMYHEVKYQNPGKDVILPEEMESDLRYLAREGYTTVHLSDILAYVFQGEPLPDKPILLTFDDGYGSNYRNLFPLLKKYKAKAVVGVIGKSADEFSQLPEKEEPYVHATWNQLLEMEASGLVELQNHSYDLHRDDASGQGCRRRWGETNLAYEQRIRADLNRLQEELYLQTGNPASAFVYPYGYVEDTMEGILEEMGIAASLTCDFGVNRITRNPDCLRGMKRICRSHGVELESLLKHAMAVSAP